jgi:solute carrier family 45 protein 1/2/4
LASRDRRLLEPDDPDADEEAVRCQELVWSWREEASKQGKAVRLPRMPFMLRNIWTFSLIVFALLMFSTFFIRNVISASGHRIVVSQQD